MDAICSIQDDMTMMDQAHGLSQQRMELLTHMVEVNPMRSRMQTSAAHCFTSPADAGHNIEGLKLTNVSCMLLESHVQVPAWGRAVKYGILAAV